MKLYLIYKFGDLFPMIVTLLERLTRNKYSYSNKSVMFTTPYLFMMSLES